MNLTLFQDLIRGTHVEQTAKFLEQAESWSKERLEVFRLEKLQRLVKYSYENVTFYHRLFDSIGLTPDDIKTLDDIRKIPILTKETVRTHSSEFVSKAININDRKIKPAKTGGTTGMPLVFYKNTATRDFTWGSYRRWYGWMGVGINDRAAVLWGARTVLTDKKTLRDRFVNMFGNTLTINCFNLNDESLPGVAHQIIDYQPVILRGYLSAVFQLAVFFNEQRLTIPSLKAISSTTETLLPIYRNYIEETFGVKMFDQYGCGECNGMAYECEAHEGLHVTEEHCIVEVLDDNDNPIFDKPGRIVLTDLDNDAFPFIRYENGDCAIMSSKECSCGRHSSIIRELAGRTKDTIILKDGSEVHGVLFTDMFHELGYDNFEYFTRFQIYQQNRGDFECRLETTDKPLPKEKLKEIQDALHRFGNNVVVKLLPKLENDPSGKFRYIISDIKE